MATYLHPLKRFILILYLVQNNHFSGTNTQLKYATRPEVKISQGALLGITMVTHKGRNIPAFLGIPYVKPPTGNLRFAFSVAADGWDANSDPSVCPQNSGTTIVGDEDCLYINLYTPQLPRNTNSPLLPVMVYFHGGGFKAESQISTIIGPGYLLDKDVVLVAPNYRLAPLGFLSTSDAVASGNWGLKDLVLALKWVQDNIRYFGGDPRRVIIFGVSAGAASVHLLTLSDATIGEDQRLFHRYITQSSSALATRAHQPRAEYSSRAFELGKYVGCSRDTSNSLISCLRTVNVSDIISTESKFSTRRLPLEKIVWGPTDEPDMKGGILTDCPTNLFANGKIRDLPWICGIVRDEGLLGTRALYENHEMLHYFLENIDFILPNIMSLPNQSYSKAWVSAFKSFYFKNLATNASETSKTMLLSQITRLVGDALFIYPAYDALKQHHALAKNPQYFYTFNYRGTYNFNNILTGSTVNRGVEHADDIVYLFRSEFFFKDRSKAMSKRDLEIVNTMVEFWTSFAKDETPTSGSLNGTVTWDPYSSQDNYLRIGNESDVAVEMEYSFLKERMQFWDGLKAINVGNEMDNNDKTTGVK